MLTKSRLLLGLVVGPLGLVCNDAMAIYASPINAGCYIAAPGQCKIHVEPITISLATGARLVFYRVLANTNVIYNFKPDQSNPPPATGSTYSPSVVMQDFAATCGGTYTIYLQGQDSLDPNAFNLGGTTPITCPTSAP